jgi:hypothetical protein
MFVFGNLYMFDFKISPSSFHTHTHTYLPIKMEQTECSETSAYKIQTPGNYPEETIQGIYICLKLSLSRFGNGNN